MQAGRVYRTESVPRSISDMSALIKPKLRPRSPRFGGWSATARSTVREHRGEGALGAASTNRCCELMIARSDAIATPVGRNSRAAVRECDGAMMPMIATTIRVDQQLLGAAWNSTRKARRSPARSRSKSEVAYSRSRRLTLIDLTPSFSVMAPVTHRLATVEELGILVGRVARSRWMSAVRMPTGWPRLCTTSRTTRGPRPCRRPSVGRAGDVDHFAFTSAVGS